MSLQNTKRLFATNQVAAGLAVIAMLLTTIVVAEDEDSNGGFAWMPAQLADEQLDAERSAGGSFAREVEVTTTPRPTADVAKYTNEYVISLPNFGIRSDATEPEATSAGINRALQHAKHIGANRIVFPKGTYLISESDPVIVDHQNTIIDFNAATLRINPNGMSNYAIVEILDGAQNVRLTNGTLQGDREEHDFETSKGSHEWGHGLIVNGGKGIEIDHLLISGATGDGIATQPSGARNRTELLAKIVSSPSAKDLEHGGFSETGEQIDKADQIRTIEPIDVSRCGGEFEFGYSAGYMGFPFIKARDYQVYFYDDGNSFVGKQACVQFRKVNMPESARFVHLEFNQRELPSEPLHAGASKGGPVGRLTNFAGPVDVHFHHNRLVANRRLGMGFCGGRRWLIEENQFEGNGGTAPGYGIDFEDGWEFMQDVVVRNNRFHDNAQGDLVVCAGSELLFEGNHFEGNVTVHGRPHNYSFIGNQFTDSRVAYSTRTGIAKIHGNTYKNCRMSIVFDTKAVADGLNREAGKAVATPPITLVNETLNNVGPITGTYFRFRDSDLSNVRLIAGDQTRLIDFRDCRITDSSVEFTAGGPAVTTDIAGGSGTLRESGAGISRRKTGAGN